MITAIRMLLSAALMVSVLSSGDWQSAIDPDSGGSTQAAASQAITTTVPQPVPALPSTQITSTIPEDDVTEPYAPDEEDPSDHDEEEYSYVLNKNTKKFHYPDCRSVKQMKPSNKRFMTALRDDIIDMGYDPCQICHP